jgi:type II secretory pathway pseudopilin PulG
MRRKPLGASGLFIAVILLLIAATVIAALALTGIRGQADRSTAVAAQFRSIQDGLQGFVAINGRLPCPANPALDTGDAEPSAASAACNFPAGTVPWKAIGIRREDAIDPWGSKISYRVLTGATGLTQAGGASMVNCDTAEPAPTGVGVGGLCRVSQNTTEAEFLAGKGLQIRNYPGQAFDPAALPAVNVNDAAYVLVSHGATGLGGFTSAGQQKPVPASTGELANIAAAGPFGAYASSTPDVGAEAAAHFDDLIAYATVGDLLRLAGVGGRDWPEPGTLLFDAATVGGAMGTGAASPGSTGQATLNFGVATASGMTGSGTATDIAYDEAGGYGGLGIAGGGDNRIQSSANEYLRFDSPTSFQNFGITVADFGYYGATYYEIVELRFLLGTTPVLTKYGVACNIDGGLASFLVNVGADFNAVEIRPWPAYEINSATLSGITALLVSEVRACDATEPNCRTTLDAVANRCSVV